jgi:hypothetical protein
MDNDKYIYHISFLPQENKEKSVEPTKNNSDEVIEVEKNDENETSNPEVPQEKTE